jgi:hypothetical protein
MSEPVHLASPMAFNVKGYAKTVQQDSSQDREDRAYNVCVCVQGTREDSPSFGIPDETFTIVPLDLGPLRAAIEQWAAMPVTLEESEEAFAASRQVLVEV